MNKKRLNFKYLKYLKVQIIIYFLVTSVFLITIMGLVFYYSTFNIFLNHELNNTKGSVERSGIYVELYIEKLKGLSFIIANSDDTFKYLKTGNLDNKKNTLELIENSLKTDNSIVSIVVVGKDGKILSNEKFIDMKISSDMMKEVWYVNTINSKGMPVLTSARRQKFSMDKDTWVISVSQEILDKETKENIGVLLLDIKYEFLENYLNSLRLGKNGYSFIMDEYSDVVYHPNTVYFEDPAKKNEIIKISNMTGGYEKNLNMLTHHYKINGTNWILVGISFLDDLSIIRRQMIEAIVMAGFILFFIVIGGGVLIASRITDPIKELENGMKSIDSGLEEIIISKGSCYEVVNLGNHFNKMTKKIDKLMRNIKVNEKYLRTYEINALQSQINPHFLYNTLDTIVWMAEFNDSKKVISITKALAEFFRISLSNGQELITLEDEINHIKNYLFIQKQRYGDKLSYSVEISDEVKEIKVPKIILQPIVENSIYHGIREKEDGGNIFILAFKINEILRIIIKDDGVGFDFKNFMSSNLKLGGIGIENVNKRIKLYYGDEYGLLVDSNLGTGTTVTLEIPL